MSLNVKKVSNSLRQIHRELSEATRQVETIEENSKALTDEFSRVAQQMATVAIEDIPDAGTEAKQVYATIETALQSLAGVVDRLGDMQSKVGAIAAHSKEGAELSLSVNNRSKLVSDEIARLTDKLGTSATVVSGVREIIASNPQDVDRVLELIGKDVIAEWLDNQ